MRVSELIHGVESLKCEGKSPDDTKITHLTLDSRECRHGSLFIALNGAAVDGQQYISQAIESGAVAVLTDMGVRAEIPDTICAIRHADPQKISGILATRFYNLQPANIAAVTGTNGKTSVAYFCQQLWELLEKKSASIGTLGVISGDGSATGSGLTTPDVVTLHATLAELVDDGIDHVCLEASSHGLVQNRLNGVAMQVAAFTNISHDHLDYHGSVEEYLQAKVRLFGEVLPANNTVVLNADDAVFAQVEECCVANGHRVITFGRNAGDIVLQDIKNTESGQEVQLKFFGNEVQISLNLFGEFQVYNVLCAMGIAYAMGAGDKDIIRVVENVISVPGRMEQVAQHSSGASILIDYAHTPDALEKALLALRMYTKNRLIVVLGCGGDRDAEKRPEMGRIAAEYADIVVVTDDNPRNENPDDIRQQIIFACKGAVDIADRAEAIKYAVGQLRQGDILLIAGKGHETGQIIGDKIVPFDDGEVVRKMLAEL